MRLKLLVFLLVQLSSKILESAAKQSQLNGKLNIAKGSVQASLSRAAVDWMVNTVNLTTIMHRMNRREVTTREYSMIFFKYSDIE